MPIVYASAACRNVAATQILHHTKKVFIESNLYTTVRHRPARRISPHLVGGPPGRRFHCRNMILRIFDSVLFTIVNMVEESKFFSKLAFYMCFKIFPQINQLFPRKSVLFVNLNLFLIYIRPY